MPLSFSILGSGSTGNVTLIRSEETAFLIDAGLNCKNITQRMATCDCIPDQLSGILITHDHTDHIAGLDVLCRKYNIPVYANEATARAIERRLADKGKRPPEFVIFETGTTFSLTPTIMIEAFGVPHDAAETVGYAVSTRAHKLVIVTDLGSVTSAVIRSFHNADVLILESNHDYEMLIHSDRPSSLIGRIHGSRGHLENKDACKAISKSCPQKLRHLILAHLSGECNAPQLAYNLMRSTLKTIGRDDVVLTIATQDAPTPFISL